jgi:hypothetical protein
MTLFSYLSASLRWRLESKAQVLVTLEPFRFTTFRLHQSPSLDQLALFIYSVRLLSTALFQPDPFGLPFDFRLDYQRA